jgi:hypothetical protein
MYTFCIVRAFELHGDDRVYRPGDEAALVATGHNISKLKALGYVCGVGRKLLANGALVPNQSWTEMKAEARVLKIKRYSRLSRAELTAAIAAAREPSDAHRHQQQRAAFAESARVADAERHAVRRATGSG